LQSLDAVYVSRQFEHECRHLNSLAVLGWSGAILTFWPALLTRQCLDVFVILLKMSILLPLSAL
jgi:hypothetical protein